MAEKGFSLNLNEIMKFSNGGIFSKVLAKSKTYNYTLMCLAKGSDIDTHTSTKNGCVQVLRGKGTFNLCGKDIDLAPGVFIHMPANSPHSLKAEEDLAILLCLTE
ncbi:MAG TPA: cupin domain-containing protein [Candidatus Omnitrophota bacterium]|nr:cupin domain-containing protein [Candidatus Omnitrophota bacterium]HPD84888.1 cupin domain-containing protein [Candidatus Omnitrophota bacterium]HRZ03746.1 cupin domain-containing protein [Candidatus Omnitrophota bacterium]